MTVSGALRAHLIAFAQAVSRESGGELQALLGVAKGAALLEGVGTNANAAVAVVRSTRLLPEAWDRVVACNLCAAASLRAADHAAAFSLTHDALVALIECVPSTVGAWIVRPLLGVAFDADALTKPARAQALREGTREAHEKLLQSLAATYRNAFGSCYSDRTPAIASSRRTGCLSIANLCFKLFFKLNTPRQCSFFISLIEAPTFVPLDSGAFPESAVVTYKYYTGRLSIYEDKYSRANACLSYALTHCHSGDAYRHNRRRVLEALIPVKLHLGVIPSHTLLAAYGLDGLYGGIIEGIRAGNVRAYRAALEEGMESFVRAGVYLLLDKLQLLVVRTFVKRLAQISGTHQLRLRLYASVLASPQLSHESMDIDEAELECLCAVLIHRRFIRGYIAHASAQSVTGSTLVVAKEKPFPRISEISV